MQPTQPNSQNTHVASVPVVAPATRPGIVTPETTTTPAPKRELVEVWNTPFDAVTMSQSIDFIGKLVRRRVPTYVITANLNYVMLNNRDAELAEITRNAGLVVADGQPIVVRSKLEDTKLPERVAGSEMIYHLAEAAAQRAWRIYFLGGEEGVAQLCAERLTELYPNLQVAGVESPPFRPLTEKEQAEQDARIQAAGTDVLLVAFGQPKGEKWIAENCERLNVPVSIQLGASFDFVAGRVTRAPKFWQTIGMEWFYRMVNDPRRLVKRYALNAAFLFGALMEDWRRQVGRWGMLPGQS